MRAVARLREVFVEEDIAPSLRIQEIATQAEAVQHRFLGSPTIQIRGLDIDPEAREFNDFGLT